MSEARFRSARLRLAPVRRAPSRRAPARLARCSDAPDRIGATQIRARQGCGAASCAPRRSQPGQSFVAPARKAATSPVGTISARSILARDRERLYQQRMTDLHEGLGAGDAGRDRNREGWKEENAGFGSTESLRNCRRRRYAAFGAGAQPASTFHIDGTSSRNGKRLTEHCLRPGYRKQPVEDDIDESRHRHSIGEGQTPRLPVFKPHIGNHEQERRWYHADETPWRP